jgi:hypothetical protein
MPNTPRESAITGDSPFPTITAELQDRACAELPWTTRIDGHIRGHAYFQDGTPAPALYLAARSADAQPHESWKWQTANATTGSDGAFDFSQLPPGSYVIAVNMDFTSLSKDSPYYRKAFFPGTGDRAEAAVISLDKGQQIDDLRFFLPPDSPQPSIPLQVKVVGSNGKPASNAFITAFDQMWESSVTSLQAMANENGEANLILRPSSTYEVTAHIDLPGPSQACAEPVEVDTRHRQEPLVLVIRHPVGNCLPFKKSNSSAR